MNKGKIIQVMGPVVDVAFRKWKPSSCIQDALTVITMESVALWKWPSILEMIRPLYYVG